MRNWHSLYEVLLFPITILLFAALLLGLGNLLTNEAFSAYINIQSDFITLLAYAGIRTATFLFVNFPILFMLRLVTRKSGSAASVLSAIAGYITFLTITMYFSRTDLASTAYSSILGLSMTSTSSMTMQSTVHYPLQTGIVGCVIVAFITMVCFDHTRNRSDYGLFSFIPRDTACVIRTMFWCAAAGLGVAYVWPYVINLIQAGISFISQDITNPANLTIYGMLDRVLSALNLSAMIRQPFWFGSNGGSWINMAGTSIAGDVNIWTAQLSASSLTGASGRFITPYYVLNIFAVPGLIWALYSLQTDRLQKRKTLLLMIILTLMSFMGGTLLPFELLLLFLCPLLFFFHVAFSGVLFGLFQSIHVYLGFNYSGTGTIATTPGTLMELITYFHTTSLRQSVFTVLIVGIVTFALYFLVTRLYFKYLALDLFRTGIKKTVIQGTIEAVGGIENIKLTHSSAERLTISLYDPRKLNVAELKKLGAVRITETRAGYAISFGASSTIIHDGIVTYMRDNIRSY